jgi:hypothetical protein
MPHHHTKQPKVNSLLQLSLKKELILATDEAANILDMGFIIYLGSRRLGFLLRQLFLQSANTPSFSKEMIYAQKPNYKSD